MEIKKSDKDVEELNEISIINNDFKIEENDDLFEIKPTILYIEETIKESIEECIICYNEYNINDGITFKCNHRMCITCYQNILNNTENLRCPICRMSLEITDNQTTSTNSTNSPNFLENTVLIINYYCKCISCLTFCSSIVFLAIYIIINSVH